MKKRVTTILLIIVFLCGLGLLLYPTIGNIINNSHSSRVIEDYEESVAKLSSEEYEKILSDARSYNSNILQNEFPQTDEDLTGNEEYMSALNINSDGVMGYIKIAKIGVNLPIYHTTDESVLQMGVGHMPMTSLPVGGKSTHAVLTGHRGLPSAKLFTNLNKMEVGDVFYIYVLDEILAYKVDKISTVEPTDTKDLQIVEGKDYVTLVTCTPYGINSQRLLVRGERVSYESTLADSGATSDALLIDSSEIAMIVASAILVIALIVLLIVKRKVLFTKRNKKKTK